MAREYKIAVASTDGLLVDQHFGHTTCFAIYQTDEKGLGLKEHRQIEKYCGGEEYCLDEESRKERILDIFSDCDGILVLRIGYQPRKKLEQKGVLVVEWPDTVREGLIYLIEKLEGE